MALSIFLIIAGAAGVWVTPSRWSNSGWGLHVHHRIIICSTILTRAGAGQHQRRGGRRQPVDKRPSARSTPATSRHASTRAGRRRQAVDGRQKDGGLRQPVSIAAALLPPPRRCFPCCAPPRPLPLREFAWPWGRGGGCRWRYCCCTIRRYDKNVSPPASVGCHLQCSS